MDRSTDICIVGAGIVGLAHAFEARRRGLSVVVLERSDRAVGASVRNFGHGFVTAMADGEPLETALRARERWLELGARAGLDVLESGSVIVAHHEDELGVLAAVAEDPVRQARMISADELAALTPIPVDGVLGALHCRLDLRVNPRAAAAGLAALLARDPDAEIIWEAHVDGVEPGVVRANGATVRSELVVVCPGPMYASLPVPVRPRRSGLTLCTLQMLRVAAPSHRRYGPALLTGLSLVRYPAFATQPGAAAVRERLAAERPELLAAGIHLIVTQLPDGDLIIGDTHAYGDTVEPFAREHLDRLVLGEAARLLGAPSLEVKERWHGVYPTAPDGPFMVECPLPGVAVVEVVSGVGMTTALGLPDRTFAALAA